MRWEQQMRWAIQSSFHLRPIVDWRPASILWLVCIWSFVIGSGSSVFGMVCVTIYNVHNLYSYNMEPDSIDCFTEWKSIPQIDECLPSLMNDAILATARFDCLCTVLPLSQRTLYFVFAHDAAVCWQSLSLVIIV